MAECPWCRAPTSDPSAPCPKCGKMAADLRATDPPGTHAAKSPNAPRVASPAMAALPDIPDLVIPKAPTSKPSLSLPKVSAPMQAGAVDFLDDGLDVGDLQIDLSGAVAKAGSSSASSVSARASPPGAGFDPFDDDLAGGPAIELDMIGGQPPRASNPGFQSLAFTPPPSAPVSSPRAVGPALPSLSPTSMREPPKVDAFEARTYADYGPPPEAFWHAPMYAWRVFARRGALKRDLPTKREDSERTTKRMEDALAAFGERARALLKEGPALARVHEAESLLKSREGAAVGTNDANASVLSAIAARLAAAESALASATDEEARAQTTRDAAEEEQRRADAKVKRLEIEIRNAGASANRAGERDTLAADLAQKTQARAAAEQVLLAAKQKAASARAARDAIAQERASQEARHARQTGVRGEGSADAQKHFRAALVDLGRAMLTDASGSGLPDLAPARDELARLESQAQEKSQALAVHESAIDAYDKGKVMLGLAVIFAAFLIMLGVLFFPVLYRSFAG